MRSRLLFLSLTGFAIFLSGASALTYEILWQRQMFLIFGASAPATTAILTAIFFGIALGSRLASLKAVSLENPIPIYAGLELVIGVWAMLVPFALEVSEGLYVVLADGTGEQSPFLAVIRFALAIVPLLPATLAMGATVPVMIEVISRFEQFPVARAYGLNTLGAVTGGLLTGLFFLQQFGMPGTNWVGVAMNGFAFLILCVLARTATVSPKTRAATSEQSPVRPPRWLSPAYFLAGFTALGFEVVWLRFLGILNSNSTVTFTFTLVVYLLGMGLGSLLGYPLLRRRLAAAGIFVFANVGTAASALLTAQILYQAAYINHDFITQPSIEGRLSLGLIYQAEAITTGLLIFLPTFFMGLVYPAVCELGTCHGVPSASWNGKAYFLGTLGSVAGILLVSGGILPQLGLQGSLALLVGLSILVGSVAAWSSFPRRRPFLVALTASLLFLAGIQGLNTRPVLRNTIARYESGGWQEYALVGNPVEISSRPISELVHTKAGRTATVMIKKNLLKPGHFICVDDQLVASTNLGAKVDAYMLAHLPLLLHPHPQSALTVGFGSGGTSHAMTLHNVETYCVEIEAEVAEAALYLTDQNFGVLENPRFHLIINDARDHLHITQNRYDVISTDVTNLQYKQNSSLYTVEYFELMKSRLNEGGIACAWIPMAAIATGELQILMKSFQQVFEHSTLWFMNHTHTNFGILVATPERLRIDFARIQEGFNDPNIAESLAQIGMTNPLQLVNGLHLDEVGYKAFCGDAELHTDNRPVLEFSSPLSFYNYYETFRDNLELTMQYRPKTVLESVEHFPTSLESEWTRQAQAADCFCRTVVEAYSFLVERARGHRQAAIDHFTRAVDWAKRGMAAWPEDTAREAYYDELISEGFHSGIPLPE